MHKSGELIYSGKNVCMGYARNEQDLSKNDENKGILRTGDIAQKDHDNFYYIVGRIDRYVKIYGNRINLFELEQVISDLGVKSICNIKKNDQINIFVKNLKKKETFIKQLSKKTQLHPNTFSIKKIKNFPMNENYKISYYSKLLK